jgi:hypothetical protein
VWRTFSTHTNTTWDAFLTEAYRHFDRPCDQVRLGYRISGDARAMSYLTNEIKWTAVLVCVKEKAVTARTRAVSMELKNMVSTRSLSSIENELTL